MHTGHRYADLPQDPIATDYVSGASLFIRSSVLRDAGRLPEQYFLYFEETDWCMKVRSRGHELRVFPTCSIFHAKRSESAALPTPAYLYYFVRNSFLFVQKYAPETLDKVARKIQTSFIDPWMTKIDQRAPNYLVEAKILVREALIDGQAGVTGWKDLQNLTESSISPDSTDQTVVGLLDEVTPMIRGWVLDRESPNQPLDVIVRIDNQLVAEIKANLVRDDLKAARLGDGYHGFEVQVPATFNDDKLHTVNVTVASTGQVIPGGVQQVTWSKPSPNYETRIDDIVGTTLVGSCWDRNNPNVRAELDVYVNGEHVNTVTVNSYRDDPNQTGKSNGLVSFSIAVPPMQDEQEQEVAIYLSGTSKQLVKQTITCGPSPTPPDHASIQELLCWFYLNVVLPVVDTESNAEIRRLFKNARSAYASLFLPLPQETKISIIMPTFNRAETIPAAIRSILGQSYQNWELLVIDDGSLDKTAAVVDALSKQNEDSRIKYHPLPHNRGVSFARNYGLSRATGDVVAYLDSDNTWHADYLLIMLNTLRTSERDTAYCGQEIWQHRFTRERNFTDLVALRMAPFNRSQLERRNFIDLNVFVHRTNLYERLGGFNEAMDRLVDWELILRYTAETSPLFVPVPLCRYSMFSAANQITATENFESNQIQVNKTLRYIQGDARFEGIIDSDQETNYLDVVILLDGRYDFNSVGVKTILATPERNAEYSSIKLHFVAREGWQGMAQLEEDVGVVRHASATTQTGSAAKLLTSALSDTRPGSDRVVMFGHAAPKRGWLATIKQARRAINDLGVIVGRQVLPHATPEFVDQFSALGTGDFDATPSRCGNAICDVFLHPELDLVEVKSIPFFCSWIDKEVADMLPASLAEAQNEDEWIQRVCEIAGLVHRKLAYTPRFAVFDGAYFS